MEWAKAKICTLESKICTLESEIQEMKRQLDALTTNQAQQKIHSQTNQVRQLLSLYLFIMGALGSRLLWTRGSLQ